MSTTVGTIARKNLSEISKMLMQISSGTIFGEEDVCLMPLNDYVAEAIKQMNAWFFDGTVPPALLIHRAQPKL